MNSMININQDNTEGTRKGLRRDYTQEVHIKKYNSGHFKIGHHPKTEFKKGHKSYPRTKEWRLKIGLKLKEAWKDRDRWIERNKKVSEALRGNQLAKGMNPNQTSFKKGRIPWNAGTRDPDYRGVSYKIRKKILIRDDNRCQLCGIVKRDTRRLNIHHIDWNHHNNKNTNLITLCESCHSMQQGHRESWITFWKSYMNLRYSPNYSVMSRDKQK